MKTTIQAYYGVFPISVEATLDRPDQLKQAIQMLLLAGATATPDADKVVGVPQQWIVTRAARCEWTKNGKLYQRLAFYPTRIDGTKVGTFTCGNLYINSQQDVDDFEARAGVIFSDMPIHHGNGKPDWQDTIIVDVQPFLWYREQVGELPSGMIDYVEWFGEIMDASRQLPASTTPDDTTEYVDGEYADDAGEELNATEDELYRLHGDVLITQKHIAKALMAHYGVELIRNIQATKTDIENTLKQLGYNKKVKW